MSNGEGAKPKINTQTVLNVIGRMKEAQEAMEARMGQRTAKILMGTAKGMLAWKALHDVMCGSMEEEQHKIFHAVQDSQEHTLLDLMFRSLIDPTLYDGKAHHQKPLEEAMQKWTEELKAASDILMTMSRI